MKSDNPIARNINVNNEMLVCSVKMPTSITSNNIRKTVPVKNRLVTIRKPPIATLSLMSFRIYSTQLIER